MTGVSLAMTDHGSTDADGPPAGNSPSQRATTTVARQLPITLIVVLPMSSMLSDAEYDRDPFKGEPEARERPRQYDQRTARNSGPPPLLVSMSVTIMRICVGRGMSIPPPAPQIRM